MQCPFQPEYGHFGLPLYSIGSPVPGQIQLPMPDPFPGILRRPLKVFRQGTPDGPRQPLQVRFPAKILQLIPVRAASSVSVPEGIQQPIDLLRLRPVLFPPVQQMLRTCLRIVFEKAQRLHPGAVRSFPQKILPGEAFAFRIRSQQLLGGKEGNAELFHQLRQTRRKSEGVRLPSDPAVISQFFPEPAFSPQQLTDQAFPVRNVRIAFRVKSALRLHSPGPYLVQEPSEQLRMAFLQHFKQGRLTGQKPVFRIFLHQRQLIGIGPGHLVPRFLHRPHPGQIDVALPHQLQRRRAVPVPAGQCRCQRFPGPAEGRIPFLHGAFKIRNVEIILQRRFDPHPAQAALRQSPPQPDQRIRIHIKLVCVLVHPGDDAFPDPLLKAGHGRNRCALRRTGTQALQPRAVACIALNIHPARGSRRGVPEQRHPGMPAVNGAHGPAIQINQLFSPQAADQRDPLPGASFRQRKRRGKPGVFPIPSPGCARRRGCQPLSVCAPGVRRTLLLASAEDHGPRWHHDLLLQRFLPGIQPLIELTILRHFPIPSRRLPAKTLYHLHTDSVLKHAHL